MQPIMGLRFGFVTKTVDNIVVFWLLLSSTYTVSRLSLFPILDPLMNRLGWARSWEGTWLGQMTQTDCRDVLCQITACSAIKNCGSW